MAREAADRFEQLGMDYETARSLTDLAMALFARANEIFARQNHTTGVWCASVFSAA